MRAVLQRVSNASVLVDDKIIGSIRRGVCVLVGISVDDTERDVDFMVKKILNIRVFENENGEMWKRSVKDIDGEILCVSQFTLYGNCHKGNKPDFHCSMKSERSKDFYQTFLEKLKSAYGHPERIQDGVFGAMMVVSLSNEGPITLELDSRKFSYDHESPTSDISSTQKSAQKVKVIEETTLGA